MKGWQWKQRTLSAVFVAITCTVLAGNAGAAECRLDWNEDYQISMDDYLGEDGISGFYFEWYICMYNPGYVPYFDIDCDRVDYNVSLGQGVVDLDDLMGTLDAAAQTEGYYSEWYIFMYTPYYPVFFPEYDVCPPEQLQSCPAVDYVDVAGPGEEIGSEPKFLTALGGKVYFQARMPATGLELRVYDPATGLVTTAVDINPGVVNSDPRDLFVHLGKLYFRATGPDWDTELYVYDPATPGTATKIDINPTSYSMPRHFLSGSDGKLYFRATSANDGHELHSYDPVSGDVEHWDHWPGIDQYGQPYSSVPGEMLEHNGQIYMAAKGFFGTELHRFDMTTGQLTRLSDIHTGFDLSGNGESSYPKDLTIFNGKLFFQAADDGAVNYELWIFDPADDSLREIVIEDGVGLQGANSIPMGAGPSQFIEYGGKLYFRAQQVAHGVEMHVYDPVTDEVSLVFDSHLGQYEYCNTCGPLSNRYPCPPCMDYGNDGHTDQLTLLGDKIYYVATFDNKELWEFDPATGLGTQILEIYPGPNVECEPDTDGECVWVESGHMDSEPYWMIEMDGNLYFAGSNPDVQDEFFMVTWAPGNCS